MKKRIILCAMSACFLLLSSCIKDDSTAVAGEWVSSVFKAKYAANTRTLLDDNFHVLWMKDDKISMNGYESEAFAGNEAASAEFEIGYRQPADGKYYAFYPAEMVAGEEDGKETPKSGYQNGKFIINFPSEQPEAPESFHNGVNLSVAFCKNKDFKLTFHNLCGILKVEFQGNRNNPINDVKKIRFEAKRENVAGDATEVDADPAQMTITPAGNTSKTMDIVLDSSLDLISDEDIITCYFVLPPQEYSVGWQLKLLGSNDEVKAAVTSDKLMTITRSKINSVGPIVMGANIVLIRPETTKVPHTGDKETDKCTITTVKGNPSNYKWSAEVETTCTAATGDGRTLVKHEASIILLDEDGNDAEFNKDEKYELKDFNSFKVKFPKLWWPNREITDIKATVKIYMYDKDGNKLPFSNNEVVVEQEALKAREKLVAWDYKVDKEGGWGCLHPFLGILGIGSYENYLYYLRREIKKHFTVPGKYNQKTPKPQNCSYIHMSMCPSDEDWEKLKGPNSDREKEKLPMTMVGDDVDHRQSAPTPPEFAEKLTRNFPGNYTITGGTDDTKSGDGLIVDIRVEDQPKRIYKFLTMYTTSVNMEDVEWGNFNDGLYTYATEIPSTAISLAKNDYGTLISIDPQERFIYIGESTLDRQPEWGATPTNDEAQKLLKNIALYIRECAKYGGAFADMLLDEASAPPAPWDGYWEANKLAVNGLTQ